ncbi:glycosyltransferase [Salinibacterium hongtaonis]|uniref:glycosyltransferase n=1 Tax=Homoserinimonas hongtaonis TaxID=2079791 RepID=UPI0018EEB099|nr:glycosyltransferase [Salinibacterium hongtaonis]
MGKTGESPLHSISVVIPVYKGETSLPSLIEELLPLTTESRTQGGRRYVVAEIILVHDNGPDASDVTIRALCDDHDVVRALWLSRNFGQHAATIAGMSSSTSEWIVTMDEDGQHDPAAIPSFLDAAMDQRASLVYAKPSNPPPHGAVRNAASRGAKRALNLLFGGNQSQDFQSYRLVRGVIGRQLAAVAVSGVYLDVALGWVTDRVVSVPVFLREEADRPSGYNYKSLFAHFWRMVLSSGTRGLRIVSFLGITLAAVGILMALYFVGAWMVGSVEVPGWTSQVVITLMCSGAILVSLGVIAEYIGVTLNVAMGRPLYLIVDAPFYTLPVDVAPAADDAGDSSAGTEIAPER